MICRLCLNQKQKYLLLKTVGEDGEDVAGIIGKYFVLPLDIISHVICTECWNQVYDFHTFYMFVEEKQRKFRLESKSLVYTTTDREKDTNAEGNVLLAENEDATNTKAGKDAAPLQTEDYEMVDFEFLENDEDGPCIQAEEDGYLGKIDDEYVSNIDVEAGDTLGDAGDDNNASANNAGDGASIETDDEDQLYTDSEEDITLEEIDNESKIGADGDATSTKTDDEDNTQIEDEDENGADTPFSDSTTSFQNPQEDTDETTDDDLADPLDIKSSKLSSKLIKDVCENEDKCSNAVKQQQNRVWNKRKKGEVNLRIASNVGDLKCDLCAETQKSFEELLQHFRKTHDCRGYVKCCNKRFFRRFVYADHLELHVNPDFFKCEPCNKVLSSRNSYNAHMSHFHPATGDLKYKCPHCPMKFAVRSRLTVHISRRHTEGEFKCEECNKIYKTLERLKSHQAMIHKCASITICDICGKSFSCQGNCKKHKARVHQKVKSQKSVVHQEAKQECPACHKWFKNSIALRAHTYNYHKEEKKSEYKCDLCGVVKEKKILLYTHKYYHHANRRFPCTYCEKAFKTKMKLKEHVATHTGIPNYWCEICNRGFNARTSLFCHRKKIHKDKNK